MDTLASVAQFEPSRGRRWTRSCGGFDRAGLALTRKLVSLAEAADALAVSTKTVRRYIADGHLDAVRLGRTTLRLKLDSIERFIDARPGGGWRRTG